MISSYHKSHNSRSKKSPPDINIYLLDQNQEVLHSPLAYYIPPSNCYSQQITPIPNNTQRHNSVVQSNDLIQKHRKKLTKHRGRNLLELIPSYRNTKEVSSTNGETPKTPILDKYSFKQYITSCKLNSAPITSSISVRENPHDKNTSRNLLNIARHKPKQLIISHSHSSARLPNPRPQEINSNSHITRSSDYLIQIEERSTLHPNDRFPVILKPTRPSNQDLLSKCNLKTHRLRTSQLTQVLSTPNFGRTLTANFLSPEDSNFKRNKMRSRSTNDACRVKRTYTIKKSIIDGMVHINEYTIMEELGRGAYGTVYKCKKDTGEIFAVKIYRKRTLKSKWLGRGRTGLDCVNNEIDVLSKLSHVNIINMYEVIHAENKNKIYLILEYATNGSLKDLIPLPEDTARVYFRQLIEGCIYLHKHNIAHKDIKPDNLLLTSDNKIKIADFGSAEILMEGKIGVKGNSSTYAYMSPELVRCDLEIYGEAVDVWSAGVTLYYMILGELPFKEKKLQNLYEAIRNKEVRVGEGYSSEFQNIMDSLLEKDPFKRINLNQILSHPWIQPYKHMQY